MTTPTPFTLPRFDSRFTARLPGDPESANHRRQVHGACWSRVRPTPVRAPRLLAHASEVAELLGFDRAFCASPLFTEVMAGNRVLDGMDPHAMCYGGHQFGNWAGQLGDGRAITLGETLNAAGERWTLQLKGAGPTPYSRTADGLAVLRSSLREFLCSEAMHNLGVPTTRALSLVTTGEQVLRDMFYDGNPRLEPGAVVCRVAPSFIRFGNFEILAARGEHDLLRALADYTLEAHFPGLGAPGPETYAALFAQVCRLTADMIVHWMRVGFVHGVMNTDNMSIHGLTLDYGPYGWLDDFDPDWTPNTTDSQGRRYRFGQQSDIALWNLVRLANALHPLIGEVEPLQDGLRVWSERFNEASQLMMAAKLGFNAFAPGDAELVTGLFALLTATETDMTVFYRRLADIDVRALRAADAADATWVEPLLPALYTADRLPPSYIAQAAAWLRRYADRAHAEGMPQSLRQARMNRNNPKYVLRNYLAQMAIDQAEAGDLSLLHELQDVLRHPYDEQPAHEAHAARRPDWARQRAGCSMLSCSS